MRLTVLGIQGSGKTYLVKKEVIPILGKYHLVIDPNGEYGDDFTRYVPKFSHDYEKYKGEIATVCKKLILPAINTIEDQHRGKVKKNALKAVVIDEADLIAPARTNIPGPVRDLYVKSRHYDLSLVAIARRATDLNAYIMDTSDFLIVFKQTGYTSLQRIRGISEDADKAVRALDFHAHEFLFFDRERKYQKYSSLAEVSGLLRE